MVLQTNARADYEMVADLIGDAIGPRVEVEREWLETRFPRTSLAYAERFKTHHVLRQVDIELPPEVEYLPRNVSVWKMDDDGEDVQLVCELEAVQTLRDPDAGVRQLATYSVEAL